MTCEKAFDRYLILDKNEHIPLSVTLHLIACPACRTVVRKLSRAERLLAKPLAVPPGRDTKQVVDPAISAVMSKISASGMDYPRLCPGEPQVSLYRWLVAGCALITGFAIIPSSSIGEWSRLTFGNSFLVPFYILCGVAVTAFCGFFVGSNIDFFVKKISYHHSEV